MPTITISRQLGSLGCQVASRVAECLGYRMVWRELINQAAQRAGVPEMALATIDELGLLGVHPSPEANVAYRLAVQQVMEELAEAGGAVIVGRAGQAILHGKAGVIHVRVVSPFDIRVERVANARQVPLEAARAQVTASDQTRRSYLRQYYQVDWDQTDLYDMILNTGSLAPEVAADAICALVIHPAQVPKSSLEVEPRIACE